jgi:tetratricopeptide (TPR) repeat protein
MNEFRVKRKKERNIVLIVSFLKCFTLAFGALMIICVATGGKVFTFKHLMIYSLYSIPLCVLYAYTVERLSSGLGVIFSGWSSRKVSPRDALSADLERARFSKRKGRFEEALSIINEVIDKDPKYPDALFLKARILWDGFGKRGEAVVCLKKVMELVQSHETLHRWASSLYDEVKRGGKG